MDPHILAVTKMSMKLKVDGKEIPLNDFVEKFMAGSITGALSSLKGIDENWNKVEIEIQK